MNKLQDKVALVYGGTSGIGEAVAKEFARNGAKVAIAGRDENDANRIIDFIESEGGTCIFVEVDLMDTEKISQSVKNVVEKFGTIDILYNGAGILDEYENVEDTSENTLDNILQINIKAPIMATKAAMPYLLKNGGKVINIGSQATKFAGVGGVSYMTSKHAIQGFTKQLAYDYGSKGVNCNLVAPGFIESPMTEGLTDPRLDDIPAQRAGQTDEVAKAVLFLASDDATYIHGETLFVDGGWTVGR